MLLPRSFMLSSRLKMNGPDKSWIYFIYHVGYLMLSCNSFVNDILVLTMDKRLAIKRKARQTIITPKDSLKT